MPPKTPKDRVFDKWKQEVEALLNYTNDPDHVWHIGPDYILEVTQRLGKLGEEEGVRLATRLFLRGIMIVSASPTGTTKDSLPPVCRVPC